MNGANHNHAPYRCQRKKLRYGFNRLILRQFVVLMYLTVFGVRDDIPLTQAQQRVLTVEMTEALPQ